MSVIQFNILHNIVEVHHSFRVDVLYQLLFWFCILLQLSICIKGNWKIGTELTFQCSLYADVSLLAYNMNTIKKNAHTISDVSKKVSVEINAEKIMCKLISPEIWTK
jgi:hypothetical protein